MAQKMRIDDETPLEEETADDTTQDVPDVGEEIEIPFNIELNSDEGLSEEDDGTGELSDSDSFSMDDDDTASMFSELDEGDEMLQHISELHNALQAELYDDDSGVFFHYVPLIYAELMTATQDSALICALKIWRDMLNDEYEANCFQTPLSIFYRKFLNYLADNEDL